MTGDAEVSDADLARAIAARADEAAESELYRRFAPRVRLYGLRHLRDDEAARDLAQQVLLTTIEKLRRGEVRDADRIVSFILGVSRQMANDQRRQDRRRTRLRETYLSPGVTEVHGGEVTFGGGRLEGCLARLPERDRLVVVLTFYGEKSASEVGKEIGVAEGNVRVIRHRAIQRLRTCISGREVAADARM